MWFKSKPFSSTQVHKTKLALVDKLNCASCKRILIMHELKIAKYVYIGRAAYCQACVDKLDKGV